MAVVPATLVGRGKIRQRSYIAEGLVMWQSAPHSILAGSSMRYNEKLSSSLIRLPHLFYRPTLADAVIVSYTLAAFLIPTSQRYLRCCARPRISLVAASYINT